MPKKNDKEKDPVVAVSVEKKKATPDDLIAGTEAGKIWSEIKDREIQMFALPGQRVSDYCKPTFVEPSRLYLLTTASSTLPSLEEALSKEYVVELVDKYTVVSRKPSFPFVK